MMKQLKKFMRAFRYAGAGIGCAVARERNMRFHLAALFYVILFGIWQDLSGICWVVEILCCMVVLSLELVNTALERLCDAVDRTPNPHIKICKDAAAGAVLVSAVGAAVVWIVLLCSGAHWDNLICNFSTKLWPWLILLPSLPLAVTFIFYEGRKKHDQ